MHPGFGFVSMLYFTFLWLLLTGPIYLTFVIVALGLYQRAPLQARSIGMRRRSLTAIVALIALTFVMGGLFGNPRIQQPPNTSLAVWCIWLLFAAELAATGIAVRRARRRWVASVALMPVLWVGMVIAWLATWTIQAGGTLGAL